MINKLFIYSFSNFCHNKINILYYIISYYKLHPIIYKTCFYSYILRYSMFTNKDIGWYLDKNTKLRGILLYILVNANRGNARNVPNMSEFMLSTGTHYIWSCLIS